MSAVSQRLPRLLPLAASLSLAFGLTTFTHTATAVTLLVTDCSDSTTVGTGTLRHTIAAANANDTVQIQAGTCSKITVHGSQIVPTASPLTIQGPGSGQLTISGGLDASPKEYHRVFASTGSLTLQGMTVTESKYTIKDFPIGGCVYTKGALSLNDVVLTDCFVSPPSNVTQNSKGGAAYAKTSIAMVNSIVTNNFVNTVSSTRGLGGGLYAKTGLIAKYSTISNNLAIGTSNTSGGGAYISGGNTILFQSTVSNNSAYRGGGFFTASSTGGGGGGGNLTVRYSTISDNHATGNGGFEAHAVDTTKVATFVNSTISGNVASSFQGGGGTYLPTKVYNSTVAFNRAGSGSFAVGLYSNQAIKMQSSIFANNTGNGTTYDVGSHSTGVLTGSDNLITGTPDAVPLGTISTCPRLGPLADNGSLTFTHQLLASSPAIDQGNLTGGTLTKDQRLATRNVGGGVDIGAYERQTGESDDRIFLAEFEGGCF